MDTQLKKGALEMCILFIVNKEAVHGYSVMKTVKEHFPTVYDGTIYTILRRLASDGIIETFSSDNQGTRKYYRITGNGAARLNKMIEQWGSLLSAVKGIGIEC